jgi:putative transposase
MRWEREEWIQEYGKGESITEIARRHGISRKAIYKWIGRYEAEGLAGLEEVSRAPHEHPHAVSELWRERVRAARQEHARWGAPKLAWLLEQRYGKQELPSVSTIGRVLRDSGMSRPRRRTRAHGTGELAAAEQANQTWAIDFKGWCRTGDGARCEPLTITDQATRYLLCCQALSATGGAQVQPLMERIFREYGLPERIRSDNGAPFASRGDCGLTRLSAWWIELGITLERIEPGHPQQNGRHERMHRTLAEATMQPPAATFRQQQKRMDLFRREFNEQRPHEALGQQVPASLYTCSARAYCRQVREPEYPRAWTKRRIFGGGQCGWSGRRLFVSHALVDKQIGFEPVEDGLWRVWFYGYGLGMWDERRRRLWRPREWERRQQNAQLRSAAACVQPTGAGVKAEVHSPGSALTPAPAG